ncbi:MAG: DNA adenine methylase [Leptolyngbyaceae cyanobacterium MO_188.B28]|nr:DNA adenine methylase [Leptolyngbyaceae cyanobacterium MO_188.B28]
MLVTSPPASPPRPFLKWAGGKGRLIEQYLPYLPSRLNTYYEPFLGGGAIFFHLFPKIKSAVLTDLNPELVNVYRCVRDQVEAVLECLKEHQQHHCKEYFYQVREKPSADPVERAARLIYLNKTCYNGLYRENSKGKFNVPMGRYKNPKIYNPDLLRSVCAALQIAEIEVIPFEAIADLPKDSQDFVYFDPPYFPISATSNFTAYNRYAFGAEDQIRLQQTFANLARRGIPVMLSNSDCPFIRGLYQEFPTHTIQAARNINSNAKRRGKITELLITSYPSPEANLREVEIS